MTPELPHAGASLAVASLLTLLAACGGEVSETDAWCEDVCSLTEAEAWQDLPDHEDPFVHEDLVSPQACGVEAKGLAVAVDTTDCPYVAHGQPLLHDLEPGDALELTFHFDRIQGTAGDAVHVAFGVGEETIREHWLEVGASGGMGKVVHDVTATVPAGTMAWFHVHDAGGNELLILDWERVRD